MTERKVYKFRIDPTAAQEAALSRYAGGRRFVFNWALARREETYEQTGKWHICLVVEFDLPDLPKPAIETETAVGIDVGFDRFATESVSDAAHRETFRQIEYKARWRNRNFIFIDRWFPSSQLCSGCGHRNQELSFSDRFWNCASCGARHDRDHNAAKNIRDEGIRILLAVGHTERLNACGASVRPATAGRSQ